VPAAGAGNFAFRKRADGGYTIAQRNANLAHIVPDSFRYFADFAPGLIKQWHELRLRIGRSFIDEWRVPRRWALDSVTPFERVRVLDPEPSGAVLRQGLRNLKRAFPQFTDTQVVGTWAGIIDVAPDAVPVISSVDAIPGFHIASGFSGHGFGIGPAAGQLMADLLTGARPLVDPQPYAFRRLQ
jgi:glycine/D-amino acid oxidase-like deaminating enzyme